MTIRFHSNILANLPLKWKFTLLVVPLLLLMELATITVIEHHLSSALTNHFLEDSNSIANTISSGTSAGTLEKSKDTVKTLINNVMAVEHDLAYIYVTNPAGELVAHSFPQTFPSELLNNANFRATDAPNHTIIHLPDGNIHDMRVPLRNGTMGMLHVGMPEVALQESLGHFRDNLFAITLLITLVGIAILLLMIGLITKPLTDQVQAGDIPISHPLSEKGCREDELLCRTLLDNIDLGITLISKDFEVVFLNAAHGRMHNRPPESFIGRKCYREFKKREEPCPGDCPGRKAMASGKAEEVEAAAIRDDGTTFNARIKAFPLRNEQQEITGFVEIVTDISNQRNLEEELRRIRSIESIGQLAGGLAHDFNNLLTTILGNIDLAKIGADPNQDFVARLNAAGKACEQARRLTNQLLTFAKGGQPIKKKVQLSQILDEACHFTLSGSSLHYILDAPANLWPVEIDTSQMSQVIHNILTNARESLAANPTGKIFVVAENCELDAQSPIPLPPGDYVKLAIADEGRGIPPEILATIFNPYFTTKELGATKGTGLGLAICHSIIQKHGGHISVESQEGLGSTFTIYLPAANATQVQPQSATGETHPSAARSALRVLILEDEEAVAHIAASFLVSLHHHGEIAGTGAEAAKLFQQAEATGNPFNLLLLDLTIRGGMGGEELLHRLRTISPTIPAIVTSGYTENQIMVNHEAYGFQAALTKPFNLATLRAAIGEAMAKPVAPPPNMPESSPQPPP